MLPFRNPGWTFVALVLTLALIAGACGGGDDTAPETPTARAAATTTSEPEPTAPEPTAAPEATAAPEPTAEPEPTPERTATPTPAVEAGWTTFTSGDGLPGNDIVSVDVHADGTAWALVALDRDDLRTPTDLALSRFEDGAWSEMEAPFPLEGTPRLRAGPDGTAWIIGLRTMFSECGANDLDFGPTGLWYFDGQTWSAREDVGPELRVPFDGLVHPDGTLWVVGIPSADGVDTDFSDRLFNYSSYAVSSFDGQNWTDVEIPDHFFYGIDCQTLFMDATGTVWVQWSDRVPREPEGSGSDDFIYHARLDGQEWIRFENPFDTTVGDLGDDLRRVRIQTVGGDGTYAYLVIGDLGARGPGAATPTAGDTKLFAGITFDGEEWSEVFTGELTITEGHSITPFVAGATPGSAIFGDVTATTVLVGDTLYLSGLGGLIRIDPAGDATTLTTADGLASNATHHITATPSGVLWVATDAGTSRFVPEPN